MDQKEFERQLILSKPVKCRECGGKLFYYAAGEYKCQNCGNIELDDYGIVRKYIEENGPTPAVVISAETGVEQYMIENMLYEGKVMIPEGSKYYLKCEKCGASLRFGRLCPECAKGLTDNIATLFNEETVGIKPKNDRSQSIYGDQKKERMYYLGRDNKRR